MPMATEADYFFVVNDGYIQYVVEARTMNIVCEHDCSSGNGTYARFCSARRNNGLDVHLTPAGRTARWRGRVAARARRKVD